MIIQIQQISTISSHNKDREKETRLETAERLSLDALAVVRGLTGVVSLHEYNMLKLT